VVSGPTRRLFVAVDLPRPLARRLAGIVPAAAGVKRARPESIHLTLHFLGDVEAGAIPALCKALDRVRAAPFTLELSRRGRFPPRGPARVLWVGLAASPALESLHAACGRAITAAGLPLESRPFAPHVTLARLDAAAERRVTAEFLAAGPLPSAAFPVERVILYASERTLAGPVHEPLHELPLRT
jgi:2'-5' RNA ligase